MSKRFLWRRIASDKSLFRRGLPGQVRRRRLQVESLERRAVLDAGGLDVVGLAFGVQDAFGAGNAVVAAGALASDSASLTVSVSSLPENTSTAQRIKVADVTALVTPGQFVQPSGTTAASVPTAYFDVATGVLQIDPAGRDLSLFNFTYNTSVANVTDSTSGPFTYGFGSGNPGSVSSSSTAHTLPSGTWSLVTTSPARLAGAVSVTKSATLATTGSYAASTSGWLNRPWSFGQVVSPGSVTVAAAQQNFIALNTTADVGYGAGRGLFQYTIDGVVGNFYGSVVVTSSAVTAAISGPDAASFEVDGTALYLKAGVVLDYESKASYGITVSVPQGGTFPYTLTVTDVAETPSVALTNTVTSLPENTVTTTRIKVADVTVSNGGPAAQPAPGGFVQPSGTTVASVPTAYFDAATGVLQIDPAGRDLSLFNFTYNTSVANVTDSTSGPFTYGFGSGNPGSVSIGSDAHTLPSGTWSLVTTSPARLAGAVSLTNSGTLSTTGSYAASTSGWLNRPWSFGQVVSPGSVTAADASQNFIALNTTADVGYGAGRGLFQYTISGVVGNFYGSVVVTSSALTTVTPVISGADAASFEIDGGALYLKAGVSLDYETKASYAITVSVPQGNSVSYTLAVTDVAETPVLSLTNVVTSLPENTVTTPRIKVADLSLVAPQSPINVVGVYGNLGTVNASTTSNTVGYLNSTWNDQFQAQGFSVGNQLGSSVWDIRQIQLGLGSTGSPSPVVGIYSDFASINGAVPGNLLATFTGSTSVSSKAIYTFTGSFTAAANTNYWVVLANANSASQESYEWYSNDAFTQPTVQNASNVTYLGTKERDGVSGTWNSTLPSLSIGINATARAFGSLLLSGPDAASFEIDGGALYLKAGVSLDYETKTSYSITVAVPQGNSVPYTLQVTNVNETPTDVQLSPTSIAENQTAGTTVGTLSTTDPDAGDTFAYSLVSGLGSADNASFIIVGNQLKTAASFDYETKNSYSIRVRSTDAGGLSTEKTFTISVTNVNESPSVRIDPPGTSLPENTPTTSRIKVGDVVVNAGDGSSFAVPGGFVQPSGTTVASVPTAYFDVATGVLQLDPAGRDLSLFNFTYNTSVANVTDSTSGPFTYGFGSGNPGSVSSSSAAHTLPSGTWSLVTTSPARLAGAVSLTNSGTLSTTGTYAASTSGWLNRPWSFGQVVSPGSVTAAAARQNFIALNTTADVGYGAGRGLFQYTISGAVGNFYGSVVVTSSAFAPLTPVISGLDAASFEIDGGALYLKAGVSLDYETKTSYAITVSVPQGNSVSYTLSVTNVDESTAPTDVLLSPTSIAENQPAGTTVGTLSTTDPDSGDTFTYSLVAGTGSTDNAAFTIIGNQLKSAVSYDFETKNSYSIRVRSTDAGGLFTEKTLTISVTNVNEPPSVEIRNPVTSLPENTATTSRIKVGDVVVNAGDRFAVPGGFVQPSGTTVASVPTAYFDAATGVLQIDPAGRDLSLFNFTFNTSVANVTDSTSGPFTYGFGSGNSGSVSIGSAAHTLPSGTWSLVTTSPARLAGAVSLSRNPTLSTTGSYAASTSGWLNRPWSFGQVVSSGSVTAATARQNFIALDTTTDVGYGAGRGLFQYTIDGVVGNFYGSVVVTSSALVTPLIAGPDAASFEIDGNAIYLKAGVSLDYETKTSYAITVSVPQGNSVPYTLSVANVNEPPSVEIRNPVTSLPENTPTTSRIKVGDVVMNAGDGSAFAVPGQFVQPSGTTAASAPTAYFDVTTGVLQIDPAGRDLSLFNFTFNTSVANVTDSTSGPFTYGFGSGNPGSVSTASAAHTLPAGTWSLVTTSPARLAGAVSLTKSATLSTTGGYAASTSGWLNRPWSFGQVVTPGSVTAVDARQNFIALNTTADVGYGAGRGLFQYTIDGVVGNFYGSVVVTSSAFMPLTPVISGPDAASFEIDGNALYLKAGVSLDYETKTSYAISVSVPRGTPADYTLAVTNVNEPPAARIDNPVTSLPENTPTTPRIKVGDVVVNPGDGSAFAVPGGFVQPSGTTVASVPTAYFDVATGVLQIDPAGRDLSLFNFTFNTSVVNVTDSTSGPFTYGFGSGNPGSVSVGSDAHTLPSGTWSLVTTSPARLAGAVSLSRNPTLSTTGSNAASTSGWLNRPWSFGQVVSPGSVTAAAARQNFIALDTTTDVGYGAGRGLFQYTINGVVGNFYGSVVVTSSAFAPLTPVISGPDAGSFEIDGGALYLKAGVSLDYETKTSYAITVSVPRGTPVSYSLAVTDVSELIRPATSTVPENIALGSVVTALSRADAEVGLTPLTVVYVPASGQMVFLNTTSASLAVQSVQIVSASRMLNGSAAILPSAAFSVLNTSDSGLYGAGSEIFFLNFSTAALTLAGGGTWDMGLVAQGGLTSGQVLSSFATDPDVDYLPGSRDGQFIYQLVGGENVRGLISYGYRTFTYSLVPGIGDTDNGLFSIDGTSLKVAGVIDYEAKSRYSIRVRSTSLDGVSIEEVLSVIATDVNEAPTNIGLSPSSVAESQPAGTSVGTFSTTDQDAGDSHTYTLVSGTGDTDNGSFEIVGGTLKTRDALDYETKSSYTIRVRSTDAGGLYTEKQFTIAVVNVNEAPTNVVLSPSSVAENQPVGTTVGTFSTTDPDVGDSHTYTLVSGAGDTDNGSFEVVGNVLKAKASFNYEVKNSYSIRVRATDAGSLFTEKVITILVTDLNEAPTGIRFDPPSGSIPENTPTVSRIKLADIVVTDDALGTNILSLSGPDAASFEIVGAALYLKAGVALDYEMKPTYSVTVSVADSGLVGPASVSAVFSLSVTNVNEAPTDIGLTPSSVAEDQPAGTAVGTFSTTDQDVGDTHTYTLVAGTGDTDNGSFEIVGGTLKTRAAFDYEVKGSYSIRVRSTDAGGLSIEKVFTILVTDVNDAPTNIALTPFSVPENQPAGTSVGTFSTTDQDAGDRHTYTLVAGTGDADNGSFEIVGGTLKTRVSFDYETKSSYTIRVRSTDIGGLSVEKQFTIGVIDVNEAPTAVGFVNGLASLPESTSTASRVKVADVVVTDDALGTNTLSLSGADAGFFEVVGNALYLKAGTSLDYGPKPSYAVTVSAADPTLAAAPVSNVFTLQLINVPEFSGREYAEVPAGQTVVDTTARTGSRQVIVRGGGTLVLAGANTNTGGVKVESGALIVRNASALGSGTLDVRAGAAVTLDIGFIKATVGAISLASGAKIDLGVSGLTIAAGGTTLDALRSAILLARNGGAWNGTSGIGSANVDLTKSKVVGYRQLVSGAFQVAWAAFGDTNLDGRINSTDVQAINTAKKFGLPTRDSHWSQGDFSYDGRVNSTDILQLSPQFGKPSYYTTTASSGTIEAPVASITAQLFAALGWVDPDGDGKP
jgi:autotransporter-associated beta strand protein